MSLDELDECVTFPDDVVEEEEALAVDLALEKAVGFA